MERNGRTEWNVSLTAKQIADAKQAVEIAYHRSTGERRRSFGRLADRLARVLETVNTELYLPSSNR